MENKCDICGDIGVPEAILTCRQCNTNCEHMYCMRVVLEKPPPDGWICEGCESVPKPIPQLQKRKVSFSLSQNQVYCGGSSGQKSLSDMRTKPHWENKPKKPGKTVYITASEAIKLTAANTTSSPLPRLSSPPRSNVGPCKLKSPPRSNVGPYKSKSPPRSNVGPYKSKSPPRSNVGPYKSKSPPRSNVGPYKSKRTQAKSKTATISSIYQQRPSSQPLQASPPRHQSKNPTEVKRPTINLQSAQTSSYKNVCLPKEKPSELKSPQTKSGSIDEKRPWLNVQPFSISGVQKPRRDSLSAQAPSNAHANVQKVKPLEVKLPGTNSVTEKCSSAVAPRPYVSPLTISDSISSSLGLNDGIHVGQSLERGIHDVQSCTDGNGNAKLLPDSEKASYAPAVVVWKGIFNIQGSLEQGNLQHEIEAHIPSRIHRKVFEFSTRLPKLLDVEMVPCNNIMLKLFPEYFPDGRDIGLYLFPSQQQSSDAYYSLLDYMHTNKYALRMQIDDVELLVFSSTLLPMNCQFWELKNFLWGVFHRVKVNAKILQEDGDGETDMEIDMIGGITVGKKDVVMKIK